MFACRLFVRFCRVFWSLCVGSQRVPMASDVNLVPKACSVSINICGVPLSSDYPHPTPHWVTQSDGLAVICYSRGCQVPVAFGVYLWVMAINILRRSKSLFVVLAGSRQTVYQLSVQLSPAQQSFYSSQRFSSAFSSHKGTALSFAELVCLLGSVLDEPAFSITCLRLFLFIAAFVLG